MNSIPLTPHLPEPGGRPRGPFAELNELLEALCEDRVSPEGMRRIEELALADRAALHYYLDFVAVHGALQWDTAKSGTAAPPREITRPAAPVAAARPISDSKPASDPNTGSARPRTNRRAAAAMAVALLALVAVIGILVGQPGAPVQPVAETNPDQNGTTRPADADRTNSKGTPDTNNSGRSHDPEMGSAPPALAGSSDNQRLPTKATTTDLEPGIAEVPTPPAVPPEGPNRQSPTRTKRDIDGPLTVAFVNDQIQTSLTSSDVKPSGIAADSEWLRRVHLDIVGRIPTPDVVEKFVKDRTTPQLTKRQRMVDQLLDDPLYVRNWTTLWTNLLIGRSSQRDEIRFGLEKFLRQSFAYNRPWSEVVSELVSAEGTPEENGASGFLLAHLNNEAVPATAITSRLFLGVQIQCSQCHANPLNDRPQNQFWEFNSFFQQTVRVDQETLNPKSGKSERHPTLISREASGPIFFEGRSGVVRAAFPRFGGEKIDAAPSVNRRRDLARLMIDSSQDQVARAMVNRTWEHFFGAGFTSGVDDMGPHNPPTHPAVLERLTDDFVKSGYDLKQLIRWVCATEAYNRSSQFASATSAEPGNAADDPTTGNQPLFSRVYVKSMTAEQLYDSMLVATRADDTPKASRVDLDRQRHSWIQQFVVPFDNEENNEATTFDGTIPQALMMMNSDLVATAVSREPGTYLSRVLRNDDPEQEKIRQLCVAALSRQPTPKEMTAFRKLLRERTAKAPRAQGREVALAEGLQDVFWAFLNSNEFVLVH